MHQSYVRPRSAAAACLRLQPRQDTLPTKCWLSASQRATGSPCRCCSPAVAPRFIAGSSGSSATRAWPRTFGRNVNTASVRCGEQITAADRSRLGASQRSNCCKTNGEAGAAAGGMPE
jgi:hypothetical protein